MAKITIKEIKNVCHIGLMLYRDEIRYTEARQMLVSDSGMGWASAQMYLKAFTNMLAGKPFYRSINLLAAKYFLDTIREELGTELLEKALISLEGHANYYDSVGKSKKVKERELIEEFKARCFKSEPSLSSNAFDPDLLVLFGAKDGAYSIITDQEAKKSQITITGHEREIVVSHFGMGNIHIGPKVDDPNKATKNFLLFPYNKIVSLTVNYPKPGKSELQVYASVKSGFKPRANDIWFIFQKEKDELLTLGSMTQKEWNLFRRSVISNEEQEEVVQDVVYQDIINRPSSPKAQRIASSFKYPRNPLIAKECMSRAQYKCEMDDGHKTFISKATGSPYIEGHHLIPLSFQGDFNVSLDVHANIVVLCPNCHRTIHHAEMSECSIMLKQLFKIRESGLKQAGIEIALDGLISLYE